ncbi:hypothetical protein OB13_19140, partial [Pontibacter sp. HJ8]
SLDKEGQGWLHPVIQQLSNLPPGRCLAAWSAPQPTIKLEVKGHWNTDNYTSKIRFYQQV